MKQPCSQSGVSYIEVLVTTFMIAVLLVPAMESLIPGMQASDVHQQQTQSHYVLSGRLEQLLSEPYANLKAEADRIGSPSIPSVYSSPIDDQIEYSVFLANYDIDNLDADGDIFTGVEEDVLWIKIENSDQSIVYQTLYQNP